MTELPYTEADLRDEAARQHAALTDPDFMGVGEQMQGQEVTPMGGVAWDDFSDETFDAAQRSIHDLITGAADLSEWAVELGADGLEPDEAHLDTHPTRPLARIHFAFDPDTDEDTRIALIKGVGAAIAQFLL
ncbi:hypothetical protein [Streptomyces sp. NEAU-H3]|uniref:hypothetical protein n=1 Tax=Streptomyces sp. NEAU-H3 TaxID=2720636 RepID=UPI00143A73FE|nr:hypothetical protein [Streptomyces sp. NEAU-H3]NJA56705.1 hypothetical protein [Streptomyces sp. NEAU-H3]